ncbi:MAG: HD family hydrolase [Candidatus Heimdallarchaeota archaeon]|nr:HD family hydrolase [Candidatus Heimdallarchaeota archaeon]MBY8994111.1 HD family hydrolase [Candidatus Heimdallarchaeota archaeon]
MVETILSFLQEALRLKKMVRSGWIYSGVSKSDTESVADHSYMITLLSLVLALNEKEAGNEINIEKILVMAILHDLPESVSQDLDRRIRKFSPKKYDEFKTDLDTAGIKQLLSDLPEKIGNYLLETYKELQQKTTKEARIIMEADRLETILQMNDYIQRGYPKELFTEFTKNFSEEVDDYKNNDVRNMAKYLLEGVK